MRYKMTFSYDGSCFKGLQRQSNLKTVQGEIEKILSKIDEQKVDITCCGRTDTGVHAINTVAHFDLVKNIKIYNLIKHLNSNLNGEIYVKSIETVDNEFHARYDCIEKEYRYYINVGEYNLFKRNYIFQYNKKLDVNKMKEALKYLLGEWDFRSFCSDEKEKENCVRIINSIKVLNENNIIEIRIAGNGFLKHMIRNIIGVLIEIGSDKKDVSYMKEILDRKSREKLPKPVPSCGLYLYNVKYK